MARDGAADIEAAGPVWKFVMRALKIAGAAVAAILVIAALLLVIGVPSGFLTSQIQDRVERETGYRLTIAGATKIGLWPTLNVTLNGLTLQDPKDRDTSNRLTVGSVQADVTLNSVWSGKPHITELKIIHPVLYRPLLRERDQLPNASSRSTKSATSDGDNVTIDRITVTDGGVVLSNLHDRVENHIDGINADVRIGADRKVKITGSARAGERPLKFDIKATAPAPPLERQNIPLELTLDAPGSLDAPLTAKAEVRLNGAIVMINGVTGTLGDAAFNGWASVDLASKPLVKLDLDFQRLDVAMAKAPADTSGSQEPQASWSNATIDLNGMNYVDAQVRISAAELNIGQARFAPAAIDATLAGGVLKCGFPNLAAYGGQVNGQFLIDATTGNPGFAMASDIVGVRALPLLQSAADFDKLDGKMQAKISVRSYGMSQRAIMSNLSGTVFANFQDGAIRGLNVAQMIRNLTSSTLSGWQEGKEQTTDLSQLSASFRIEKGQAVTTDLNLVGPLVRMTGTGTIDLGTKQLAFRVEAKLVMTTEGQGRASDPVGLGIPVMIEGPWAQPRIYPDMAGILDNPDAAYAKLKEMGKGLFGANGGGLGGLVNGLGAAGGNSAGAAGGQGDQLGKLGETLGNLFQQGIGRGRGIPTQTAPTDAPAASAPPPAQAPAQVQNDPPPAQQDSQPMNDVLRQLFNR
jgi:AsmA protein